MLREQEQHSSYTSKKFFFSPFTPWSRVLAFHSESSNPSALSYKPFVLIRISYLFQHKHLSAINSPPKVLI